MLKIEIIAEALAKLDARIAAVTQQIVETEQSQAEDSKSSAGDKFETGRERLQQELDRLGAQKSYLQEQRMALEYVGRLATTSRVAMGSLVLLSNGMRYLLAVGFGKLKFADGKQVFVVSPEAPIGQALLGKEVGDSLDFRGDSFRVEAVD